MKTSIRRALVDSQVVAVAILVLLVWSLDSAIRVLDILWLPATDYLATAIAFSFPNSPYSSHDQVSALVTLAYLFEAITEVAAAWLLSRWAFGRGPLRALHRAKLLLLRRNDD